MRNSLVLQGVTPLWQVAQWVSRAPPHHILPAFWNLNGRWFNLKLNMFDFNRYRRGLEICPQAKMLKSGHAIFFSFFRRVWLSTKSKLLAFTFEHFRLYRLKNYIFPRSQNVTFYVKILTIHQNILIKTSRLEYLRIHFWIFRVFSW